MEVLDILLLRLMEEQFFLLQIMDAQLSRLFLLLQVLIQPNSSRLIALRPLRYSMIGYTPKMFTFFDKPQQFKEHFRISLPAFHLLMKTTGSHKSRGWNDEIEWTVFLAWIASGASYRVVGLASGMARQSVCDIVHRRMKILLSKCKSVIKVPTSLQQLDQIGAGFAARAQSSAFQCAIGAIDGSHISCHVPQNIQKEHINRKKRVSIQLQAVCDHKKKFLDVFVGYPGSVHDSRVLRNSPLFKNRLYPPNGYCILGDSGYPCITSPIALVTPFKEPLASSNSSFKRFNTSFSKARVVIEIAFGLLKLRWRSIFDKDLSVNISRCSEVVMCCCILHNICIASFDDWDTGYMRPNRQTNPSFERDEMEGSALRNNLYNQFMNAASDNQRTPAPSSDHQY